MLSSKLCCCLHFLIYVDVHRSDNFQRPWSADKAVQQLGRSHRSNQLSAPHFQLVVSDCIVSEYRFAAAVAARISSLGALTKGDRRATNGSADVEDLGEKGGVESFELITKYASAALEDMVVDLRQGLRNKPSMLKVARMPIFLLKTSEAEDQKPELDLDKFYEFSSTTTFRLIRASILKKDFTWALPKGGKKHEKFLNRLFEVELAQQKNIFRFFEAHYDRTIADAKAKGEYTEGLVDVAGETFKVKDERVLHTDKETKAKCKLVQYDLIRRMKFEDADAMYRKAKEDGLVPYFFKLNNRPVGMPRDHAYTGVSLAIGMIKGGQRRPVFYKMYKPNTGRDKEDKYIDDITAKNTKFNYKSDYEALKQHWITNYNFSEHCCLHGYNCQKVNCTYGKGTKTGWVITGAVLGVWSLMSAQFVKKMSLVGVNATPLEARDDEESKRYIGIQVPDAKIVEKIVASVEKLAGLDRAKAAAAAAGGGGGQQQAAAAAAAAVQLGNLCPCQ